jgi:hypothetical protein
LRSVSAELLISESLPRAADFCTNNSCGLLTRGWRSATGNAQSSRGDKEDPSDRPVTAQDHTIMALLGVGRSFASLFERFWAWALVSLPCTNESGDAALDELRRRHCR